MSEAELYQRIGHLEMLVRHLYETTCIPVPDSRSLYRSDVSDHVRQLVARGDKIGAIKAYRAEAGVDLATAKAAIDAL